MSVNQTWSSQDLVFILWQSNLTATRWRYGFLLLQKTWYGSDKFLLPLPPNGEGAVHWSDSACASIGKYYMGLWVKKNIWESCLLYAHWDNWRLLLFLSSCYYKLQGWEVKSETALLCLLFLLCFCLLCFGQVTTEATPAPFLLAEAH